MLLGPRAPFPPPIRTSVPAPGCVRLFSTGILLVQLECGVSHSCFGWCTAPPSIGWSATCPQVGVAGGRGQRGKMRRLRNRPSVAASKVAAADAAACARKGSRAAKGAARGMGTGPAVQARHVALSTVIHFRSGRVSGPGRSHGSANNRRRQGPPKQKHVPANAAPPKHAPRKARGLISNKGPRRAGAGPWASGLLKPEGRATS